MVLNGAQIIIEILKEQGVDTVFGYPGSSVLKIYDELYKNSGSIRHILTSHEQGAAHAADGYARASGRTGVCIATSGPGATNLVTGIATAYMDSVPLLALTCNVDRQSLGKDSFQEVDINGITMPVTKHGYIIKDIEELVDALRRAFAITMEGRPGPVIVDITKNVLEETTDFTALSKEEKESAKVSFVHGTGASSYAKKAGNALDAGELKQAAALIGSSKRPLILAGGGAVRAKAKEELETLAGMICAPVICSLMGKGAVNELEPFFGGMLGTSGLGSALELLEACDLLICAGIRFSDRMTGDRESFAKNARILQIEEDPAEINKNIMVDAYVRGDAKAVLKALTDRKLSKERKTWETTWKKLISDSVTAPGNADSDNIFNGEAVVKACFEVTGGNAIITTEVGRHQMLAAAGYKTGPEGLFITSGGLGTMGYGLSAAMGAKLARPEKTVINLAGDGCFRMNMNELLTASRHDIPVIQVVFDNKKLELVHDLQRDYCGGRYSATEFSDRLDFVKLSEALGVKAVRVETAEEFKKALKSGIRAEQPLVIDCALG